VTVVTRYCQRTMVHTNFAISLIEKRLRDAFPGITFEVHGTPKDLEGALGGYRQSSST